MRDLERVRFERDGQRDGENVYSLWIDGRLIERGLGIDEVVRLIADRDEAELPRRVPAAFRTPEDHLRESWEMRECQKAW